MQGADGSASTTGAVRGHGSRRRDTRPHSGANSTCSRHHTRANSTHRHACLPALLHGWPGLEFPLGPGRRRGIVHACHAPALLREAVVSQSEERPLCLSEPSVKWCMLACPSTRSSARHRLAHKHLLTHMAGRQHSSWPCPWCDGILKFSPRPTLSLLRACCAARCQITTLERNTSPRGRWGWGRGLSSLCHTPAGGLPVSPGLRRCRPVLLMHSLGFRHVLYGGPGSWAVQGVTTCSLSGLCGLTDDACAGLDRKEGEYWYPIIICERHDPARNRRSVGRDCLRGGMA